MARDLEEHDSGERRNGMKVAVIGSWRPNRDDWAFTSSLAEFREACHQIGSEIVRNGHVLLVGSEDRNTADFSAVEGAIAALGAANIESPQIIVLRPNDNKISFENWRRQYPRLFGSMTSPDANWDITKIFQVKEADCVVLLGGAETSYQAGLTAAVSGKRTVPIGSFGGAGKRLLRLFASGREAWRVNVPSVEHLGQLHGPWTSFLLELVSRLTGLVDFPTILIVHGRSNDLLELKDYLQNKLGLPRPLVMKLEYTPGLSLPEKFEKLAGQVHAAIALVTADDIGRLAAAGADVQSDAQFEPRARENVWLEIGWFWGRVGRSRFLLLCRDNPIIPSDLRGLEYYPYHSQPSERGEEIRQFVKYLKS